MNGAGDIYLPFDTPYRLSMGLMSLRQEEWFDVDGELAADLAEKDRLLAEMHDDVYVELPQSAPAQTELWHHVVDNLAAHHPDHFEVAGAGVRLPVLGRTIEPESGYLEATSRLVQEDLCLMERDEEAWRMTAGCVCFPTRWNLPSKLGQALDKIHQPVPGYQQRLARPVSRFFDHLKIDKPVWRLNWSLVDDPALYLPGGHGRREQDPTITPENAGERIWLRVERQTLTRLPRTGAIVFTIRIHRWALAALAERPAAARQLGDAIRTMPAEMQQYKSMPVLGAAVLGYLDTIEGMTD
jgi:hypothetical protein